ncbi:MAG: VanZ family protein [Acidovorax sp.]|uniref:VanZ family protein n=1 Tax=Acidovorax sp. TaxID=1872122 RepID=UPI002614FA8D|nr:VanZ family protein [Acidovorax sp.]MDH4464224.1 VanZ family protein [Acidovorax sp.]
MHKSAAWPLAWLYAGLVVYASCYPFVDWRDQGIAPWEFLFAPMARYWTGFDVGINILGYVPLGALLTLGALRTRRNRHPLGGAVLVALLLSLAMEALQSYLPARVPSREDFLLNTLGAALGATGALLLERLGAIDRWSRVRARWFVSNSRGGLVLLALWPVALLFPAPVPLGLGQVLERVGQALADWLSDTPYLHWLPARDAELTALAPGTEMLCVALGLLIPCLLGFGIVRQLARRLVLVLVLALLAVAVTALSAALSWGPLHAWAWLDLPAQWGLLVGTLFGLGLAFSPWRASAALALVVLGLYISVLNQAPESPYFAQTLQHWEQGRFIRFHGLAQWLGWLWPYGALVYLLAQLGRRREEN